MATYEYMCLACERRFEERRSMSAAIQTSLACPSCGSDRVRRQFSFIAGTSSAGSMPARGCACGGACACRG